MAEYDNELTGVLFKNERQREGKSDPQARGSATIDGVDYWVSAWTNTNKEGVKYQRLKFQRKEPKADAPAPAPADDLPFDDAIPF